MKFLIQEHLNHSNRHNLFVIRCKTNNIASIVDNLSKDSINSINIGYEIAITLKDQLKSKYLSLEVQEQVQKFVSENANGNLGWKHQVVAIYNIGILFEPTLQLDVQQIIADLSKRFIIIILWDALIENEYILHWGIQSEQYYLDLSELKPKILEDPYEIQRFNSF